MIEFVDPRADVGAEAEPYELTVDPTAGPLEIGLVANGFPDSEAFLDLVQKSLAVELPVASFRRYNKGNASSVISDAMLDDVVGSCQAVVAAYGH